MSRQDAGSQGRRLDARVFDTPCDLDSSSSAPLLAVADPLARRDVQAVPHVDGDAAVVWAPGGKPRVVFDFTIAGGRIVGIDLLAVPEHVAAMEIVVLE